MKWKWVGVCGLVELVILTHVLFYQIHCFHRLFKGAFLLKVLASPTPSNLVNVFISSCVRVAISISV